MTTLPQPRYIYEPLLDRWCVYRMSDNGQRKALFAAYTEDDARDIAALLNHSALTVQDTLGLVETHLTALLPGLDCDARDFAEYSRGVKDCIETVRKMEA